MSDIDIIVRDLTKVHPLSKSQVKKLILDWHKLEMSRNWWVTDHTDPSNYTRVLGPFTTASDAGEARTFVELHRPDNRTFWIEQIPEEPSKAIK